MLDKKYLVSIIVLIGLVTGFGTAHAGVWEDLVNLFSDPVEENLGAPSQSASYQRHLYPRADSTYDVGTTTLRWRNGYFDNLDTTNIEIGGVSTGDIDMNGNDIDNIGTATTTSLYVGDLTSGRVTYATTGGQLTDSANLTFDGTDLTVGGVSNLNGGLIVNESGSPTANFRVEGDTDQNLIYTDSVNDRVGIGTNTPSYKLDVSSMSSAARIDGNGYIAYLGDSDDSLGYGASAGTFVDGVNGAVFAGDTFAGYFDGNVGIGTASPTYKLDVSETSATAGRFLSSNYVVGLADESNIVGGGAAAGNFYDGTNTVRLAGSGFSLVVEGSDDIYFQPNVGIGTASPSVPFHVVSALDAPTDIGFRIEDSGGGGYFEILSNITSSSATLPVLRGVATGYNGYGFGLVGEMDSTRDVLNASIAGITIQAQEDTSGTKSAVENANVLMVRNYATPLMTIDSTGNVGIGTASPATQLHVGETTTGVTAFDTYIAGATVGSIYGNFNVNNGRLSIAGNTSAGFELLDKTGAVDNKWAQVLVFDSNLVFRSITDAGGLDRNLIVAEMDTGNVGIGTDSPSALMHGIKTTEQLRLGYDVSNYLSATVDSSGNTTFNLVGTTPEFEFSDRVKQPGTFANIYVEDGSTAQSIATGATYTKLTGFATNGESANATNDVANDKITLTKTGRYHISYAINGSSGTANVTFKTALFVGGVEMGQVHSNRKYGAANDIGSESGTGIIDITSPNTDIDLRMRHDNGGAINFTPIYMSLVATYLGET